MFIEQISCFKCDKEAVSTTKLCTMCQEKEPKEEPREKVTVEDILWLLDRYVDALSIYHNALSAGDEPIVEKHTLMSLNKHYLMREIKYLVSLQEN